MLLSPNMAEGDPTLPDNIVRFRRKKRLAPPPMLDEIKASPTTWVAMTVEQQMTELAGILAKDFHLPVKDIDTLAYSIGIEALLNYYLSHNPEALHPKVELQDSPQGNVPEDKPSA
jgi:hypothetical protein